MNTTRKNKHKEFLDTENVVALSKCVEMHRKKVAVDNTNIVDLETAIKLVYPTANRIEVFNNYRYRTAYFDVDDTPYYLCTTDIGIFDVHTVEWATTQRVYTRKGGVKGANNFDFLYVLNALGYVLGIKVHKTADYGSHGGYPRYKQKRKYEGTREY